MSVFSLVPIGDLLAKVLRLRLKHTTQTFLALLNIVVLFCS